MRKYAGEEKTESIMEDSQSARSGWISVSILSPYVCYCVLEFRLNFFFLFCVWIVLNFADKSSKPTLQRYALRSATKSKDEKPLSNSSSSRRSLFLTINLIVFCVYFFFFLCFDILDTSDLFLTIGFGWS